MSSAADSLQSPSSEASSITGSKNQPDVLSRPQTAAGYHVASASPVQAEREPRLPNTDQRPRRFPSLINSLRSRRPPTPTSPSRNPSSSTPCTARRQGRSRSHHVVDYPSEVVNEFVYGNLQPVPVSLVPSPASQASLPTTSFLAPPVNQPFSHTEASTTNVVAEPGGFLRRARSVFNKPRSTKTETQESPSRSSETRAITPGSSTPIIRVNELESTIPIEHQALATSGPYNPSLPLISERVSRPRSDSQDTIRPSKRSDSQETIRAVSSISSEMSTTTPTTQQEVVAASKDSVHLHCPPWDRRVDLKWSCDKTFTWSGARELIAFRTSVAMAARAFRHTPTANEVSNPFCRLPDKIRYMICKYLVNGGEEDEEEEDQSNDSKPIRLNTGTFLYKAAWPETTFQSLEDTLDGLENYTSVCYTLRTDVLMTLFNTRRFHIVLSPYPLTKLDPIGHDWFGRYSGYMQFLTIEVDFTRLSMGKEHGAALLDPSSFLERFERRLEAYGAAQKARALYQKVLLNRDGFFSDRGRTVTMARGAAGNGGTTVHDLTITVRRYFGHRPAEVGQIPQKYSDDKYLAVLEPLQRALGGKVSHLRVVGTSIPSARDLIASVWQAEGCEGQECAEEWAAHTVRLYGQSFYSSLSGQASVLVGANDGEYYFQHPGDFSGPRDFLVDEVMVKGQLAVGPPEAAVSLCSALEAPASGHGQSKGKEKEKGPLGVASGSSASGSSTSTEPFPEVPDEDMQWDLLAMQGVAEAIERVAARNSEEEGEGVGKGRGRMREFSGKLQEKMSRLVSKDKPSRDSDGKE